MKIEKFRKLLEMSIPAGAKPSGVAIDIEKVNLSSEQDDDEAKAEPIMRVAHKKNKFKKENNIV